MKPKQNFQEIGHVFYRFGEAMMDENITMEELYQISESMNVEIKFETQRDSVSLTVRVPVIDVISQAIKRST